MKFIETLPFLIAFASLAHATKKSSSKRIKQVDDDFAFLDEQIKMNDIRSYYDINTLNATLYLPTLIAAQKFTSGMFKGLELESQVIFNDTRFLSDYMGISNSSSATCASSSASKSESRFLSDVHRIMSRSSYSLLAWSQFNNALENLIRHEQPHPMFFELITNLFVTTDIASISEHINLNLFIAFQEVTCGRSRVCKKVSNIRDFFKTLFLLVEIDLTVMSFPAELKKAINTIDHLVAEEAEMCSSSAMSASITEILAVTSLYSLLFPLIQNNKVFNAQLRAVRAKWPSMARMTKKGLLPTDDVLDQTLEEMTNNLSMKFMSEKLFCFELNFFEPPEMMDISAKDIPGVLAAIKLTNSLFLNQSSEFLALNSEPIFTAHSKLFSSRRSVIDSSKTSRRLLSREEVNSRLSHTQKATFDLLMNIESGLAHDDLYWEECKDMIKALNGNVTTVVGNIVMVAMEGRSYIRFDKQSYSDVIGIAKGTIIKRIVCEGLAYCK